MSDGITHGRWNTANQPRTGGVYKHYKGGLYAVLAVLSDSDDRSDPNKFKVGYISLSDGRKYWRDLYEWNSLAELTLGKQVERFVFTGYSTITIDQKGRYNVTLQF